MTDSADFDRNQLNLACFAVRGQLFALDVYYVREIVRPQAITPLPQAPILIEGVIDLRGNVIPVLDLGRLLGGDLVEDGPAARIVVIEVDGLVLGLKVAAAVDVLTPEASALGDPPALATQAGYELVRSVVRREGEEPVLVLSVEHMLEAVYRSGLRSDSNRAA